MTSCWSCGATLDDGDRFCRRCGEGQGDSLQWYYRPLWIAVLTLTVLGPLSVFLVWRTPRLGRGGRLAWTVVILGATALLIGELWVAVRTVVFP